jgi:hypothetical protein
VTSPGANRGPTQLPPPLLHVAVFHASVLPCVVFTRSRRRFFPVSPVLSSPSLFHKTDQTSAPISSMALHLTAEATSARTVPPFCALFAWLISHQPVVLFSQNKPATSNQPTVLFSQNKPAPAISHQPTEQAAAFPRVLRPAPLDARHASSARTPRITAVRSAHSLAPKPSLWL